MANLAAACGLSERYFAKLFQGFCSLYGSTDLLDQATLMGLYPDHTTYMAAVNTSLDDAVLQGFILPEDADLIRTSAEASNIGNY